MGQRRCCLSRVWPARKGRPIQFDVPDLAQPGGAPAALAAIARLTADGVISCEEAGEIAKVAETYMRATDMIELVHRIELLEAAIAAATGQPGRTNNALGAATRRVGGAAVMFPPLRPVVIYDPADGVPKRPADAPPDMVFFFLPSNGRDKPEVLDEDDVDAGTEASGDTEPAPTERAAEDQPRWRDEIF